MKINWKIKHRQLWVDSMVGMTWGFVATLIAGTIIGLLALGQDNTFSKLINQIKGSLTYLAPFGIGIGIALKLKLAPLQVFSLAIASGLAGHSLFIPSFSDNYINWVPAINFELGFKPGDIFGAWIVGVLLAYFFVMIKWKNPLDLFILPLIGIIFGLISAFSLIYLSATITVLFQYLIANSVNKYHWAGILLAPVIGALMGLALSLPTSSAAIAFSVNLQGDAATAAIAGTSAQMIAFGLLTYMATKNKRDAFVVAFGSSMLQMANFMAKPKLLIIPTITSALAALIAVSALPLDFVAPSVTSGMGTSALYGPIFTLEENGWTNYLAWINVILLQMLVPVVLSVPLIYVALKKEWIVSKELILNYA